MLESHLSINTDMANAGLHTLVRDPVSIGNKGSEVLSNKSCQHGSSFTTVVNLEVVVTTDRIESCFIYSGIVTRIEHS